MLLRRLLLPVQPCPVARAPGRAVRFRSTRLRRPRPASIFAQQPRAAPVQPQEQHPTQHTDDDDPDPLNLRSGAAEEPVIRFFEQDISKVGSEPPRPVSDARIEADQVRARELWRKIQRLEAEVEQLENDDDILDPTIMKLKAMLNGGPDEEVETLADADADKVREEMDALWIAVPGALAGTEAELAHLQRLNNCLRHAYLATNPEKRPVVRQELWKAYKRAKLHVPGLLEHIPDPAWDILFYSQAVRWKSNKKREEHMRELRADMKSVGMDGPPTKPPDEKDDPADSD